MNTKTLEVGQNVNLSSGVYGCQGTVVSVTPSSVVIEATVQSNLTRVGDALHFDAKGQGNDNEGTFECGPWYIDGFTRTLGKSFLNVP